MTLKAIIKKCKLDPCLLYRLNELGATISVIYVDDTLELEYELALVDSLVFIKKLFESRSMSLMGKFIGWTIKCGLTKITLKISQLGLIEKCLKDLMIT